MRCGLSWLGRSISRYKAIKYIHHCPTWPLEAVELKLVKTPSGLIHLLAYYQRTRSGSFLNAVQSRTRIIWLFPLCEISLSTSLVVIKALQLDLRRESRSGIGGAGLAYGMGSAALWQITECMVETRGRCGVVILGSPDFPVVSPRNAQKAGVRLCKSQV